MGWNHPPVVPAKAGTPSPVMAGSEAGYPTQADQRFLAYGSE